MRIAVQPIAIHLYHCIIVSSPPFIVVVLSVCKLMRTNILSFAETSAGEYAFHYGFVKATSAHSAHYYIHCNRGWFLYIVSTCNVCILEMFVLSAFIWLLDCVYVFVQMYACVYMFIEWSLCTFRFLELCMCVCMCILEVIKMRLGGWWIKRLAPNSTASSPTVCRYWFWEYLLSPPHHLFSIDPA